MSIANIWCDSHEVICGVDSAACDEAGRSLGHVSKALLLANQKAIVAARGRYGFFMMVAAHSLGCAGGFDELVAAFPGILKSSYQQLEALRLNGTIRELEAHPVSANGALLAGWSPSHARMRALIFEQTSAAQGFVPTEILPGQASYGPGFESLPVLARPVTAASLAKIARQQVREASARYPNAAWIGGRFNVFSLTRDRASSWTECEDLSA